ncbi:glutathione S-transferase family protein [Pyruvatibacter mobilis]|uniref:glutathione S-transferase family protein n=1 Tax=Pyruvatibacter mobilis TaxID=1712261 RepID=UPI003C7A0DE6
MSDEIILHQYELSPFSEKVRVVMGIKGLSWRAVEQPIIMPKPDLVCLTGGYRKIPVLQIGADIYCDSQMIIRELDRRFPETPLPDGDLPGGTGLGYPLGFWTDREVFQAAVAIVFGGVGDQVDDSFKKDREAMMGRPFDTDQMKQAVPLMIEQMRAHMSMVETQLSDGRLFIGGDKPGIADASAYYNIWFIRMTNPAGGAVFDSFTHLPAWEARVKDIGWGTHAKMTPDEAIAVAKAGTSKTKEQADPGEPNGLKPGMAVQVMADDYGRDPIAGTLVMSSATEIAIRRQDERLGEVVVHFPRAGFWVLPG